MQQITSTDLMSASSRNTRAGWVLGKMEGCVGDVASSWGGGGGGGRNQSFWENIWFIRLSTRYQLYLERLAFVVCVAPKPHTLHHLEQSLWGPGCAYVHAHCFSTGPARVLVCVCVWLCVCVYTHMYVCMHDPARISTPSIIHLSVCLFSKYVDNSDPQYLSTCNL